MEKPRNNTLISQYVTWFLKGAVINWKYFQLFFPEFRIIIQNPESQLTKKKSATLQNSLFSVFSVWILESKFIEFNCLQITLMDVPIEYDFLSNRTVTLRIILAQFPFRLFCRTTYTIHGHVNNFESFIENTYKHPSKH